MIDLWAGLDGLRTGQQMRKGCSECIDCCAAPIHSPICGSRDHAVTLRL